MKAMYLPRTFAGTISDTIACATGASPPTPTPIRKRQTIKAVTLQAAAAAKLADQHGDLKYRAASDFIGCGPGNQIADKLAGKCHSCKLTRLRRGQVERYDN